ncbi:MAG: TonB-dependent receptor plug domain-containing protein [Tidjanibacter sp.]|nr:TonB-dependent receptor plug domain-containing protein [Tidjanibacter sp.]
MKKVILLLGLLFSVSAFAQQEEYVPFNGRVVDEEGKGIKKVRVELVQGKNHTITDKKGYFAFLDVAPTDSLLITARNVDYIIPVDGKKSMMVCVADGSFSAREDDELVSIAYGNVRKSMRVDPGSSIKGDVLVAMGFNTISEAIIAMVPGVAMATSNTGEGGSGFNMRGVRSVNATNETLLVLDGMVVPDFSTISLRDVDTIDVLKDGSIYGSRGANGVIVIKTKRF